MSLLKKPFASLASFFRSFKWSCRRLVLIRTVHLSWWIFKTIDQHRVYFCSSSPVSNFRDAKKLLSQFLFIVTSASFCKFLFLRKDKLATNWNFKLTVNLNEAFMRHQLTTSLFIFCLLFFNIYIFCFCFSSILLDQIEAVFSWRWRKIILICFPDADISDEWNIYVIVSCRAW